jgi:long-chain fatty acid transport protein
METINKSISNNGGKQMKRLSMAAGIVVLACVFFFTNQLFAAGVDLTGIGARAQALGGNYRAVADDWSAIYWNPAGLVFTSGWHTGISTEFINAKVGYTPIKYLNQNFSATSQTEITNEPKTFFVPSGGVYYSTDKYAAGVGVWATFGLGSQWDLLNTAKYNAKYPQIDFDDDLTVLEIQPSFSYKLCEKLSVGLGLKIIMADIMIRKPNFTPNPYVFDPKLAAFKAALAPTGAVDAPYNYLITESKLEGDGNGFGADLGIMFKPTSTLSIGASVNYYPEIDLDGTVSATTYFADNQQANGIVQAGVKPQLDNLIQLGLLTLTQEQYLVLTSFYSGQLYPTAKDKKISAKLPLPLKAGVGISYTGISNLLLAADVAFTQWSVWDVIEIKDENGDIYSRLHENWEDGIRAGVGAEYTLNQIKLRGAFYTEPNAAVSETLTPTIPDINRRNVLIAGIEIPVGPFKIHASYEKMLIDDKTVDEWNFHKSQGVESSDRDEFRNLAGLYTMSVNNFMFGADFNF